MARSIDQIIADIQPVIRDRTDAVVTTSDHLAAANRCSRFLLNEHGIYATKNTAVLDVYKDVYEYPLPGDYFELRELQNPGHPIKFHRKTATEFWLRLNQERMTIADETVLGNKFLLVNYPGAGQKALAHDMDSLTANGTWAVVAASDAVNIGTDEVIKKQGGASIKFDIDVSNSVNDFAAIENSTLTSLDLSSYNNGGSLFSKVYLGDTTNITNITARWGSDSSNYYEASATTQQNGLSFENGWNFVKIDWSDATTTGSPVDTAIDYLYLQVTYSSSQTDLQDIRFDDVFFATPEKLELSYYSVNFVEDGTTGAAKASFEDGSDKTLFNLQDDDLYYYYMLAEAQWILELFNERQESLRLFDQALKNHKARYPSERKPKVTRYY